MNWEQYNPDAGLVARRMALVQSKQASKGIDPLTALRKQIEAPTAMQKAGNFVKAVKRLATAATKGSPLRVSVKEKERRLAICRGCEYWNERGNIGLGECRHSKCGCTRFKHGLATERCPANKW